MKRREENSGETVRDTIFGENKNSISGLKVPRQCPLILLV
jgi:hypothetical protein